MEVGFLRRNSALDRARLDHQAVRLVAHRRARRQSDRVRHLHSAACGLSPREDAAGDAALVRRADAGCAGRDPRRHRGLDLGLGRPSDQRHHRAVPGGVLQHDDDPASAHRRTADRRRAGQFRLGPARLRDGDCRAACRCGELRLRDRAEPWTRDLRRVEFDAVVERAAEAAGGSGGA